MNSEPVDIVGFPRSKEGDLRHFTKIMETLIDDTKKRDLNICALKNPNNVVKQTLNG